MAPVWVCHRLSPTGGSWRGAQSSPQAGAEELRSSIQGSQPTPKNQVLSIPWPQGMGMGSKRNLCCRKNGYKSPIMVLTTPSVGGGV